MLLILALMKAAESRYLNAATSMRLPYARFSEHVRLSADLKVDALGGSLRVVDGLCTRLDVGGDAVVVARGEGAEVAETMEGDGVLGRAEARSGGVARHLALLDVVRRLRTEEEAIAAEDGVRGESGPLVAHALDAI